MWEWGYDAGILGREVGQDGEMESDWGKLERWSKNRAVWRYGLHLGNLKL